MNNFWKNRTLEELENDSWEEPNYSSNLIRTCHQLRKKELSKFTIEDLRIMIGQNIGLLYLVPIGLEKLNEDIFASGDFYDGDLLQAILKIKPTFWKEHPNLKKEILVLISGKEDELDDHNIQYEDFFD